MKLNRTILTRAFRILAPRMAMTLLLLQCSVGLVAQCITCPVAVNNATPSVLQLEFNPYPPADRGQVDLFVGENDPRNGRYSAFQVSTTKWAIYQVPADLCCDDLDMTLHINEKKCYLEAGKFTACGPLLPPPINDSECQGFLEHCQLEIQNFVREQISQIDQSGCAKWQSACTSTDPIRRSGQVGIGTERVPAGYDLAVRGGILTSAVTIKLCSNGDWCDFVFDPHYPLRPIGEVADFIEQNGHLPEMVSAAQVASDQGFELKQVKVQQLQKIEEAFLYVLQTEERLAKLRERVDQLRVENERLSTCNTPMSKN
ncbi:MAG: hypothetical protein AAFR05_22480 [Bacteroidota bacterium]